MAIEPARPAGETVSTSAVYELHRDPRSSHQRIARHVRSLGLEPILDVGASAGHLGRLLARSGLAIDGIEPDPAAAAEAEPYYRNLQTCAVESARLEPHTYRVVVCADVLEHLYDPERELRRLLRSMTPDGVLIVSVPNVAHLAARLLVLAGRFPRHSRGIFDRTHRHFYTRDTLLDLLASVGLTVGSIEVTPVPLETTWPAGWSPTALEALMRAQSLAGRIAPRLFGFQWLVVASRDPGHRGAPAATE